MKNVPDTKQTSRFLAERSGPGRGGKIFSSPSSLLSYCSAPSPGSPAPPSHRPSSSGGGHKRHTYLRMSFLLKKVQSCRRKTHMQSVVWPPDPFLPPSGPHRSSRPRTGRSQVTTTDPQPSPLWVAVSWVPKLPLKLST